MYCYGPCPQPCSRPPPIHTFAGNFQPPAGKSPVRSLFLGPGAQGSVVPAKSLFPQSCVSSGCSMLGLMATSCKRTYAIPAPRASVLAADHRQPVRPQETLKHSSVSVSVGSLGPGAHKVCLSPLSISGRSRFNSKHEFAPPTVLLGLRLCPCAWGISSQPLQCLPSYWGFSDLERGVYPHGQSREVQPPLLTLDVGYLLSVARCSRTMQN